MCHESHKELKLVYLNYATNHVKKYGYICPAPPKGL